MSVEITELGLRLTSTGGPEMDRTLDSVKAKGTAAETALKNLERTTKGLTQAEADQIRTARQQIDQLHAARTATDQLSQSNRALGSHWQAMTRRQEQLRASYGGMGQGLAALATHQRAVTAAQVANNAVTATSVINYARLREGMTSLAASTLALAPGVAGVSSALGAMALGAAPMIAILAGIAAVGFAWRKLTQEGRELKQAAEEAAAAVDKMRLGETASLALQRGDIQARVLDNQFKLGDLRSAHVQRPQRIAELERQIREDLSRIEFITNKINEINADSRKNAAEEGERALTEQQDRFNRWYEMAEAHHQRLLRYKVQFANDLMSGVDLMRGVRLPDIGRVGTAPTTGPIFPTDMDPAQPIQRPWQQYQRQGMSTDDAIQAVFGVQASFLGIAQAAQSIIGGFIEARQAAKELADQMKRTAAAVIEGFQGSAAAMRAQLSGDQSAIESVAAGQRMRGMFSTWQQTLPEGIRIKPGFGPTGESADEVLRWLEGFASTVAKLDQSAPAYQAYVQMLEVARLEVEALRKAELERAAAMKLENQRIREDLQVRLLAAQGRSQEASDMAFRLAQQREYDEAVKRGLEKSTLAALKLTQAAESAARAAAKAADSMRHMEEMAIRGFRARGMGREADIAQLMLSQRLELDDWVARGLSKSDMAAGNWVHQLELNALLLEHAIQDVTKKLDQQLAAYDQQLAGVRDQIELAEAGVRLQEQQVEATKRVVESLSAFAASLVLNPSLTVLSPAQQLIEARRQFDLQVAAARGGDRNAAMGIPDAARTFLEASRGYNASGPGYVADFLRTQATIEQITTQFGSQLTVEQQMLAELQRQTTELQNQIAAIEAAKAAAVAASQAEIDALKANADAVAALGPPLIEFSGGFPRGQEDWIARMNKKTDEQTTAVVASLNDVVAVLQSIAGSQNAETGATLSIGSQITGAVDNVAAAVSNLERTLVRGGG